MSATATRPDASAQGGSRVLAVDVLRGLTIAFMILVNDPGDWDHVYGQLDHAPWNGFTATDLVFPTFLFLVGASIVFSLQSRIARGEGRGTLAVHIVRRAVVLVAIKLFLSAFPHFHVAHLRLFGVLTRIAVCYLLTGLLVLAVWNVKRRAAVLIGVATMLLAAYWMLMRFVPVPGLGMPVCDFAILDPECNLAAWLDRGFNAWTQRWLHTGSLYNRTHDPEGLLSTLPAMATTLLGSLTALGLRCVGPGFTSARRLRHLVIASVSCLALGLAWGRSFPINKNLWTSSYVLYSAGWTLALLALCYWLVDVRRTNETRAGKWLLYPWLVFGSNAITAFVISNFLVEAALAIHVANPDAPGKQMTLWVWIYRSIFARHGSTELTSLVFALVFTALCWVPNWLLHRRRIFLKI